ncbi:MAG TPA: hypothetical protein VFA70_06285 [Dehalococcoidia bacterium]|nr:hypothetical protein [Dehalococcoidia bacterium]
MADVPAHTTREQHAYYVHFPAHPAREADPHYRDFDAYHRRTRATARCWVGERVGYDDCRDAQGEPCSIDRDGVQSGLELHHAHVEFALQNGISLAALERDYPGVSDPTSVGAWVESATNLRYLCVFHHRGAGGAHTASHADWEAQQYVLGLLDAGQERAA